jgi:hypothetical protein
LHRGQSQAFAGTVMENYQEIATIKIMQDTKNGGFIAEARIKGFEEILVCAGISVVQALENVAHGTTLLINGDLKIRYENGKKN